MTGHEDHVERPDPGGAEVAGLRALADEQAAVLRVAEQIARTAEPAEVLATVTAEASRLLGGHATTLVRFDGDRELVVVASHDGPAPIGSRITFEPATLPDRVLRGGAVVRVDDYTRSGMPSSPAPSGWPRRWPPRSGWRARSGACWP